MQRLVLRTLFLCLFANPLWGQPVAIEDPEFLGQFARSRGFLLGRPVKPRLTSDDRLYFLRSESNGPGQSLFQWKNQSALRLVTPEQLLGGSQESLSAEEKARNERQRQLGTGITNYLLSPQEDRILLPLAGALHLYDLSSGSLKKLPIRGRPLDPKWSPDGQWIAYVRAYDLYAFQVREQKELRLTYGGRVDLTHGLAEFVAQEEMRRLSGYCWSPDSKTLAFQEVDQREVEVWHLSDPLHPDKKPVSQFYPRPGKKNVRTRVGLVSLAQSRGHKPAPIEWLPWDPSMEYLGSLAWDPKGGLTLQLQDRLQQRLQLVRYRPGQPRLQLLAEQEHSAWVPLRQDLPLWLTPNSFVYSAPHGDRIGLALYQVGRPTPPRLLEESQDYDLLEVVGLEKAGQAILCRIDRQPGNPQLHWVPLPNGQTPRTPDLDGVQEVAWARKSDSMVLSQHSMAQYPRLLWSHSSGLEPLKNLDADPDLELRIEFETVESASRSYRTLRVLPKNYREHQKYPVIVEVYGGPTKVQVAHSRRNWLMSQWLANQGFIVVAADNRGTPGRGRAWETAVYGRFGDVPISDQIEALRTLAKNHPEMDLERVGIWGWSFGGTLSAQGVLKYPEVFRAAVAGAPVTDWLDYDTHYTERYLGTPQKHPQAYTESSLLPLAHQLQRPLLLVHGSADDNVYYRHSLRLSESLFRAGRPHELLTLPGITHSFRSDVQVTEQLWDRLRCFFQLHLGRPEGSTAMPI